MKGKEKNNLRGEISVQQKFTYFLGFFKNIQQFLGFSLLFPGFWKLSDGSEKK